MTSKILAEYNKFVLGKYESATDAGFEPAQVHSSLFDFQADIARWAIRKGRAAIFADTGLGKTRMQLEWARQVVNYTDKPVLILAPLAVANQTVREALKMDIDNIQYCRSQDEIKPGITVANYEMLKHFDPSKFVGIVLDESSLLKSYTGATKRHLLAAFRDTPYKLACTATPSPNDHLELGNHAEFLGIMRSNEMISRFFVNDSMQAGGYRLKGHARKAFWEWVASWAVSITKPSDMGYNDDGFILPPLNIQQLIVTTEDLPAPDGELFRDASLSATTLHKEMRLTAPRRAEEVANLVNGSNETWIVWCNTNYEADALKKLIPDALEIRGDETPEKKESKILDFLDGKVQKLITKPSMFGFGLNLQHCHKVVFVGLSYSYEQFYQSVRRCWRFGQKSPVDVFIVTADSERSVLETIRRKQADHELMQHEMAEAVSRAHVGKPLETISGIQETGKGNDWTLYLGDCVHVMSELPDRSVDFCIHSPPFSNLYIYSDSAYDMGNCKDYQEFFTQYRYVARELHRITRDGRLVAIHCKDLPLYKNRDGAAGLWDFPGKCIECFESEGWTFHSRVTIWKDPVIEMQRTKNHGLLYKQLCKDSAASRQGMADYLIVLRKWGDESLWEPVTRHGERFFDYLGSAGPGVKDISRARSAKERERLFSIAVWQRYASPVWFDIQQTNVLNVRQARDDQDEKHIAPLQLDVIERAVELWTNPGDTVFSPFAGLGSEGYQSLKIGRKFVGIELKKAYWEIACMNLRDVERHQQQDFLEVMA